MKTCRVCGSIGQDADVTCGVCGQSLVDVQSTEAPREVPPAKTHLTDKSSKTRLALALSFLVALLLVAGLIITFILDNLGGILIVIVGLLLLSQVIGIGPSQKMRTRGWRTAEKERDLEEEEAEESD